MKAAEETALYKKSPLQKQTQCLRFTKTPYTKEVELEKHPSYMLGVADLTSENQALTDFMGSVSDGKDYFLM